MKLCLQARASLPSTGRRDDRCVRVGASSRARTSRSCASSSIWPCHHDGRRRGLSVKRGDHDQRRRGHVLRSRGSALSRLTEPGERTRSMAPADSRTTWVEGCGVQVMSRWRITSLHNSSDRRTALASAAQIAQSPGERGVVLNASLRRGRCTMATRSPTGDAEREPQEAIAEHAVEGACASTARVGNVVPRGRPDLADGNRDVRKSQGRRDARPRDRFADGRQ